MSVEHIEVNGRELTAFDLPPEPRNTYHVDVGDENAKLRELVRDMLHWMPCHGPCGRCERYKYPNGCEFERRSKKLGVDE